MTIHITHAVETTEFLASFPEVPESELPAWLAAQEAYGLENELNSMGSFFVNRAVSSEGDVFDNLEFRITARFTLNGETYIEGSGFRFNYSEYIRDARAAIAELKI